MKNNILTAVPLITLVGPPNSGKTTLFNYLSGKNYKTVNYPGATVEYSICKVQKKFDFEANVLDSPGIVSLIPNSPDEEVSVSSLYSHPSFGIPDIVVVTADASQLSRHLLLVQQMIEAKFNVILALTMVDLLKRKGLGIDIENLSSELNCKVVEIDGRTGDGVPILLEKIEKNLAQNSDSIKEEPIILDPNLTQDRLLQYYRDIEEIENKVIYESAERKIDLDSANKELNILNKTLERKVKNNIDKTTLKIDRFLLHRIWGLVAFFFIMALTFTSIFWFAEPIMNLVDMLFGFMSSEALAILGNNWFGSLIANGIISGTGAVAVFVPQIIILFLILGLLEDTGYLARGAMLIDRPLSKIGLNGRSFVPMLSGFACAIPAMMATRTIPNKRERLLTIFIIPLMSCSARLPVYTLLLAFLFPLGKSWIAGLILACIYIFSTISSITVAGIVNKLQNRIIKDQDNSSFILELPSYRIPKLSVVTNNTLHSAKLYMKKAGPIILFFSIIIWFLTYFPNYNPTVETQGKSQDEIVQLQNAERLSSSYASDLGKLIQPVMKPIGMDWRVGVSLISAFAAREVFVSSLALIFKVTGDEGTLQQSILKAMRKAEIGDTGQKLFTTSTIFGLIVFFIFAMQCMSTLAVSRKETGSWRIPLLQLFMFSSVAYLLTFLTVNGLRMLGIN